MTPDLSCFGKVIGGGLPIGAFGGRAEIMEVLAPLGPVYQAGTLSGNPLATAAGLAVLAELDEGAYMMLEGRAAQLAAWLSDVIGEAGLPITVPCVGPLLGLHFASEPAVDYDDARRTDEKIYAAFFHAMLDRGVAFAPGPTRSRFRASRTRKTSSSASPISRAQQRKKWRRRSDGALTTVRPWQNRRAMRWSFSASQATLPRRSSCPRCTTSPSATACLRPSSASPRVSCRRGSSRRDCARQCPPSSRQSMRTCSRTCASGSSTCRAIIASSRRSGS